MLWIFENQLPIIVLSFVCGLVLTFLLFYFRSGQKTWKIADLVWISAGGASAATALVLSVFLSEIVEVRRDGDVLSSEIGYFNSQAKKFFRINCQEASFWSKSSVARENLALLCIEVEKMDNQTASDANLVRFASLFSRNDVAGIYWTEISETKLGGDDKGRAFQLEAQQSISQDFEDFLNLIALSKLAALELFPLRVATESEINPIIKSLLDTQYSRNEALEFQYLFDQFSRIRKKSERLEVLWNELLKRRNLLVWRVISLCILALVFPLRIGKSINDLAQIQHR